MEYSRTASPEIKIDEISLESNLTGFDSILLDTENLVRAYGENHCVGYLSEPEVIKAVRIVKNSHEGKILRFISADYFHPTKIELITCAKRGKRIPRRCEVLSMCLATNETFLDTVDLTTDTELADKKIATFVRNDIQPALTGSEFAITERICKEYQPLIDSLSARGLDIDWINTDAWCVGHTGPDCDPSERIVWPLIAIRNPLVDDIPYARPVEGIDMRISLTDERVIRLACLTNFFDKNSVIIENQDLRQSLPTQISNKLDLTCKLDRNFTVFVDILF